MCNPPSCHTTMARVDASRLDPFALADAVLGLCALLIKQFNVFPRAMKAFDEAFISFRRIERFLRLPEVAKPPEIAVASARSMAVDDVVPKSKLDDAAPPATRMDADEALAVRVDEAVATWSALEAPHDDSTRPFELRGISFSVRRGEVCFVLGEVGCGKSSL